MRTYHCFCPDERPKHGLGVIVVNDGLVFLIEGDAPATGPSLYRGAKLNVVQLVELKRQIEEALSNAVQSGQHNLWTDDE